MSDLKTLAKTDPLFESYLLGTFSNSQRAIPVLTLNPNTDKETVTFEIVDKKTIQKPNIVLVWLKAFKVKTFAFILFPAFLVLIKNFVDKVKYNEDTALSALFGLLAIQVAINLRNDFNDHIRGIDRINNRVGSRAIQQGWLTANQVRNASWFFVVFAMLFAIPAIMAFPNILIIIALSISITYWTIFRTHKTFKDYDGGEIMVMLMAGPLLMCGFEFAIIGQTRVETLFLGMAWGWIAIFPLHLRNLEHLIANSQAGLVYMVNKSGFDYAKVFIKRWWMVCLALFAVYQLRYGGYFYSWYYMLVLIFITFRFFAKLSELKSPAGSDMISIRKRGNFLFAFMILLWAIENVWYLVDLR